MATESLKSNTKEPSLTKTEKVLLGIVRFFCNHKWIVRDEEKLGKSKLAFTVFAKKECGKCGKEKKSDWLNTASGLQDIGPR